MKHISGVVWELDALEEAQARLGGALTCPNCKELKRVEVYSSSILDVGLVMTGHAPEKFGHSCVSIYLRCPGAASK